MHPAGFSVTALAELHVIRRRRATFSKAGLSAEMAFRFEKAFGVKADTQMRMQSAHELAQARAQEDEIVVKATKG